MKKTSILFQINQNFTQNSKNFIYKGKNYPFDFDNFKRNSKYFYNNRKELKYVENVNLLNEDEEKMINISDDIIHTFINCCQNQTCQINMDNVFQLQFLSYKYGIQPLSSATSDYIMENRDDLFFQSLVFKSNYYEFLSNESENETNNLIALFDTNDDETIIVSHLNEYLNSKQIFNLSIPVLDRILQKFLSKSENNNEKNQNLIIEFLFKCLDKFGKDASTLFSIVNFKQQKIKVIKRLIENYYDVFDFSMINSTLLETTNQLIIELSRLKEDCISTVSEIKRNSIEAEKKRNSRFEEELIKMQQLSIKEKEEMKKTYNNQLNEIKKVIEQSFKKQKDEMQKLFENQKDEMQKSFEKKKDEMQKSFEKQKDEIIQSFNNQKNNNSLKKYFKIVRETVSSKEYENLSEDSKTFIFNEIMKNPLLLSNTNKICHNKNSPSLSMQISCADKIFSYVSQFPNKSVFINNKNEFIAEMVRNPIIKYDQLVFMFNNGILKSVIENLCNYFKEAYAEIKYPNKLAFQIFNTISQIASNDQYKSNIKIILAISGSEFIGNKIKVNNLITQCKIDSSIKSIPDFAFANYMKLSYVNLQEIRNISDYSFFGCKCLTKIVIPSSVTRIGSNSFNKCSSLIQIIIPDSVISIGNSAFSGCSSLAQITIPSSVNSIGERTFEDCSSLIQIEIPSSVNTIKTYTFNGCSSLVNVTIPSSVTKIGNYAFYKCVSLVKISIPSTVTKIGSGSFSECILLENIIISSPLTKIESNTFNACKSLEQINIPLSVTKIGSSAFKDCESLKQILIPSSVTNIESSVFSGCSSLLDISLPSSLDEIDWDLFANCTSLQKVKIPSSIKSIGWNSFKDCTSLCQISDLSKVTQIGKKAFKGCLSLVQISIPSAEFINECAFEGCTSLRFIHTSLSLIRIEEDAFKGCSSLIQVPKIKEDKKKYKSFI